MIKRLREEFFSSTSMTPEEQKRLPEHERRRHNDIDSFDMIAAGVVFLVVAYVLICECVEFILGLL